MKKTLTFTLLPKNVINSNICSPGGKMNYRTTKNPNPAIDGMLYIKRILTFTFQFKSSNPVNQARETMKNYTSSLPGMEHGTFLP